MSFGTLALIGACAMAGPFASAAGRGAVPIVVGEILAGIVIGRSGFGAIDPTNPTLAFLSDIGFAMLMFNAGLQVPLREPGLRTSIGQGAAAALAVAALAVGAGWLVSRIGGVGHPAVYTVLLASSSAALALPIIQERGLRGPATLRLIAQVTVADVGATLAVPLVLRPGHALHVALGSVIVAAAVIAIFVLSTRVRRLDAVQTLRHLGKQHHWAIDLRTALIVLFTLGWIAQRTGASLLIAGFGAGLMVAAIGGPKRLSTEVLGIAGGFFIPLFFVVLGASLNLSGLFDDPALLGLAAALAGLNVAVHVVPVVALRRPAAAGLVASAQLGVPSAIVALGLQLHVITGAQGAAILAAALLSIAAATIGAAWLARSARGDSSGVGSLPLGSSGAVPIAGREPTS